MLPKDIQRFFHIQNAAHRAQSSLQLILALLRATWPNRSTLILNMRSAVICFALAAGLWCTPDVFAQASTTLPPEDTNRPAVTEASSHINWDAIRWVERRYKIEAMSFKAHDETGIDFLGSDEVMIETTDPKGWTVSNEIGNIDTGDTHHFDPAKSCIVAVRPGTVVLGKSSVCDDAGEPGPLSFQVEFWEKDTSPFGGFCITASGEHVGPYCVNDTYGDDFIGRADIYYSTQELEAALPNVGDEQLESIELFPCPAETCGTGPDQGDYTFAWRVTRLPDVLVNLGTLVNEAMQKSGARSELEAITNGLRLLRQPSLRRTER